MQTFLPYQSFAQSAKCLDRQRLGKQRVECLSILKVLKGINKGYSNHLIVLAWKDYRWSLFRYSIAICNEWIDRGYKDTCKKKILDLMNDELIDDGLNNPHWLNDEFCSSHRAALLMKNYEWYSQFNWIEVPKIDYKYPVKE